jgi:hypothetical protein
MPAPIYLTDTVTPGWLGFPPIETTLIDGDVAFRQHRGGQTPAPNWPTFLTFAARYLKSPPASSSSNADLHLTEHDVLETHGLSVLLFHNEYHRVFGDQKMNGMEIILRDQRIATSGDVRLSATPEQWDPIPDFKERKRIAPDEVAAVCTYPDRELSYRIDLRPEQRIELPATGNNVLAALRQGGFNLSFWPTIFWQVISDG